MDEKEFEKYMALMQERARALNDALVDFCNAYTRVATELVAVCTIVAKNMEEIMRGKDEDIR